MAKCKKCGQKMTAMSSEKILPSNITSAHTHAARRSGHPYLALFGTIVSAASKAEDHVQKYWCENCKSTGYRIE